MTVVELRTQFAKIHNASVEIEATHALSPRAGSHSTRKRRTVAYGPISPRPTGDQDDRRFDARQPHNVRSGGHPDTVKHDTMDTELNTPTRPLPLKRLRPRAHAHTRASSPPKKADAGKCKKANKASLSHPSRDPLVERAKLETGDNGGASHAATPRARTWITPTRETWLAKQREARKLGRPSKRTPGIDREILGRLAQGEYMQTICESDHMPAVQNVIEWQHQDRDFREAVARARTEGAHALAMRADELLETATPETIQVVREQVSHLRWRAARLNPSAYGDKAQINITGQVDHVHGLSDHAPAWLAGLLDAARAGGGSAPTLIEGMVVSETEPTATSEPESGPFTE